MAGLAVILADTVVEDFGGTILPAGDQHVGGHSPHNQTAAVARLPVAASRECEGLLSRFGAELAEQIGRSSLGEWVGPYRSAFGLHLVYVSAREPGHMPPLEEIRSVVEREWLADRRQETNDRFFQALRSRYRVSIELPGETSEGRLSASGAR